jgi:hypothetical protein
MDGAIEACWLDVKIPDLPEAIPLPASRAALAGPGRDWTCQRLETRF